MWFYLQCGARSRVVHDRVRSYTYSFHPAGVVHMYPLAPNPVDKLLQLSPRHRPTEALRIARLTATAPSCPSRLGCIPSQEVALELCGSPLALRSLSKAHGPPASG